MKKMQGTWAMAFRGRKADILKLMEQIEAAQTAAVAEAWRERRFSKDFEHLEARDRVRLLIGESDGDLEGIGEVFRTFSRFVPVLDACLYTYSVQHSKSRNYTYIAAGGGRTVQFEARSNWRDFEATEEDFDELEVVMDGDGVEWRVPQKYASIPEIFLI